uniref:Uncharacterized protein n=1 Tax=Romanomermis culicivorax TaxID=13658 RepID=A0A915HUJ3_ROMCU
FASILDYLPGSKFFLKHTLSKLHANVVPINDLIDQHLKNHHFDAENVGDVADALYKRSLEIPDEEYRCLRLSKEHLQRSVLDLFIAGFVTVTETFVWSLACMAKYPHVQEKVQKELDDNLQRGRFPTVDDR